MDMIPVVSSNLHSVGYDGSTKTLYIRFQKSGLYEYYNVPEPVYQGLMNAPSKGHYFSVFIKQTYRYRKISP